MPSDDERPSSRPPFWNERYADREGLFGRAPNAFVESQAHRIPTGSEVLELGAGEARTLLWLAQKRAADCTAVDFSREALETGRAWARQQDISLDVMESDVRDWTPNWQWDAVIVTFLQLLPEERRGLYRTIRRALRPGGLVIAEWFRPDHLSGAYDRIGPSTDDRMVPVAEVASAFADDEIHTCRAADVTLAEGPLIRGEAAVVRLVARRS